MRPNCYLQHRCKVAGISSLSSLRGCTRFIARMWLAMGPNVPVQRCSSFPHGINTEAHDRSPMQVPRSLAPWSLCNGLKAVITECSRNLPNNGPVPTIIVPQNILKATVWSRSASGPSADASALNVPFDLEACSSIVMGIWISHMETEKPDVDQSFHVEMVR